jgi:radical SAM superfamily enzyme YgiQ (UPF0313 family)
VRVLLVGCYELGHQPLRVATAAGRLRAAGHDVRAIDLAVETWDETLAEWADRVAISVPMHTATRIARSLISTIRPQRPGLAICAYGLYAPMLADVADHVLAGEVDVALTEWVGGAAGAAGAIVLDRSAARPGAPLPARDLLPPLDRYTHLVDGDEEHPVAYVEASHGCAHRCRHCPVPVIYDGRIRIVAVDDVIRDVEQQVAAGARHVTFGDPDFFNGVQHSLRVAREVHARFPTVTFDCTVKVEHILRDASVWPELADLGCLFVVSAFESTNEAILGHLAKGHTRADASLAVDTLRRHGIEIRPTWLPFTPWTALADVQDLLRFVVENRLVANVDPVQYTIRLLVPRGSLLLRLPEMQEIVGDYDAERGAYPWRAADPSLDALQASLAALVEDRLAAGAPIHEIFTAVCDACDVDPGPIDSSATDRVPRLTEPWFCCAEPTALQLGSIGTV